MTIEQYNMMCIIHGEEWVKKHFPRCTKYANKIKIEDEDNKDIKAKVRR